MKDISLKDLLEAGCHFGHQAARWHPKATDYIFAEKAGVHIIDLEKTKSGLVAGAEYLRDLAKNGGSVIFVGVKRQARGIMEEAVKKVSATATETGFYYLLEKWPGGLLTNFLVIKKNLDRIKDLEVKSLDESFTKKERLLAKREMDKLIRLYGGLVGLTNLPEAIFLVDVKKLAGPVREAKTTGVKIVAICDSNIDPEPIDFPIPANDDAVGSVKIIVDYLVEAWIEGTKNKVSEDSNAVTQ